MSTVLGVSWVKLHPQNGAEGVPTLGGKVTSVCKDPFQLRTVRARVLAIVPAFFFFSLFVFVLWDLWGS